MKQLVKQLVLLLVSLLTLIACSSESLAQELRLTFIDVGQGDAVLIQSPSGQNVLYDGGDRGTIALDYLLSQGIDSLDLVIASHAHSDHIGGLIPVIEHYRPRFFMDNGIPNTTATYQTLLEAVLAANSTYLEPSRRNINLGDVTLTVIPTPQIEAWGHNNNSIGIIITYGAFSAALTGDAEPELFDWWLQNHRDLLQPVQIYKSSHHGSRNGDTRGGMQAFRPEVVVIGVGAGNTYGHPHGEALSLYQEVGATVYRTDLHGSVTVTASLSGSYHVTTERGTTGQAEARAPPPTPTPAPQPPAPQPPQPSSPPATCIDINSASRESLKDIIHIDEVRSGEMLTLRPFRSVEDMTRINGIGQARLRDIQVQGLACVR